MRLYDLVQQQFFTRSDIPLLSTQQIDHALRNGMGLFWYRTERGDYHRIARAKVAAALGVALPGRAVELPATAFQGRLVNWKAATYAAFLAQLYQGTPSRGTLCREFGVSLPTLLEWERRSGVEALHRYVYVDPAALTSAAAWDELNQHATARRWVAVRGPRGRVVAGRRLMDSANNPFDDYWQVITDAPAWENNATTVLAFQVTNFYRSPLRVCPTGRGNWLRDELAMGCDPDNIADPPRPLPHPKRFYDSSKASKWLGRNRSRPAIIQKVLAGEVRGEWQPSRAVQWEE